MPTSLEDQIRAARWGGEWNAGGVDRVSELANLLRRNGISTLGQLQWSNNTGDRAWDQYGFNLTKGEDGKWYRVDRQENDSGVTENRTLVDNPTLQRRLMIGGREVGFLGDSNNDGSISNQQEWLQDGNRLGWSAQGHGNVGYHVAQGPNGLEIRPSWGSSSDMDSVRGVTKVLGTVLGGGSLLDMAINGAVGAGVAGGSSAAGGAGAAGGAAGGGGVSGSGITLGSSGGAGLSTSGIGTATGLGSTGLGSGSALTAGELAGAAGGSGLLAGGAAGMPATGLATTGLGGLLGGSPTGGLSNLLGNGGSGGLGGGSGGSGLGGLLSSGADWLKDNPLLGRLLFAGATGLLTGLGNRDDNQGGGGGGGSQVPWAPKTWTAPIQRGIVTPVTQVQPAALRTTGQANSGAWRWR